MNFLNACLLCLIEIEGNQITGILVIVIHIAEQLFLAGPMFLASKISIPFYILCILFSFQGTVFVCKSSVFIQMYLPFFHSVDFRVFGQSPPLTSGQTAEAKHYVPLRNWV